MRRASPTSLSAVREPSASRIGPWRRTAVLGVAVVLCAVLAGVSLFVGSGGMSLSDSFHALLGTGSAANILIVQEFRVPRTILALLVGAALGAAGAVIQGLTRNPLADPGILGVNAGAYLCVAIGAATLGIQSTRGQTWLAMAGALLVSLIVYVIGAVGRQGGNPVHLVLTGVAIAAVLSGISSGIILMDPEVFDQIRYWGAGSLQGRGFDVVYDVLPFIAIGLVLTVALSKQLNSLALGDDLARALGTNIVAVRVCCFLAITLLCGAATAAAGPLSFIGLMVPHAVRSLVGPDQRWVVPLSAVCAPVLVIAADIVGRVLLPQELPVGVVVAFLGAPVLIWLIRRQDATTL